MNRTRHDPILSDPIRSARRGLIRSRSAESGTIRRSILRSDLIRSDPIRPNQICETRLDQIVVSYGTQRWKFKPSTASGRRSIDRARDPERVWESTRLLARTAGGGADCSDTDQTGSANNQHSAARSANARVGETESDQPIYQYQIR